MAADVISTPQLVPFENRASLRDSSMKYGGPFRATELWNDIISYLRAEVEVKRRRLKMKTYDACFTGSDAVDVVLQHLQAEKMNFSKDISREKAIKLCQLLMEHNVFEPVSGRGANDESRTGFDDSTTKLYRFIDEDSKENKYHDDNSQCDESSSSSKDSKSSGGSSDPDLTSDSVSSNVTNFNRHGQIVQELMDITGTWKRHSAECLRKITPGKFFQKRPSLPDTDGSTPKRRRHTLPPAVPCIHEELEENNERVEAEIRREVVLSRLLTMVELPILDGILSYEGTANQKSSRKQPLAFSNLAFKRQESICSIFEERTEDMWLESAAECLECCPKGGEVLDLSFSEDTDRIHKLRLYTALVQHYSNLSAPLWTDNFLDLQVALLNLLMQERRGVVLQALQLAMMLLPVCIQEEIRRLLTFMSYASAEEAIVLTAKESNKDQLERLFAPAIIKNKVLAPHQAAQLVWFMVDHCEAVFSVPPDVEDTIQGRLDSIVTGRRHLRMELTYCVQVTHEEFRKQQLDATQSALVNLMNSILDDTSLTLKDKKHRLKQFSKHHPDLHKRFFSDIH